MSWESHELEYVRSLSDEASAALQGIQNHLGKESHPAGVVQFPRGFLPKASEGRERVGFVSGEPLRTNLSYALMLKGVYDWILVRTDLAATAREMVIKASLFLNGSIAEALLNDTLREVLGRRQKFTSRTTRLRADGAIDEQLEKDLNWLWEQRNRQHLFEIPDREIETYSDADYRRADATIAGLIESLHMHYGRYDDLRASSNESPR